MDNYQTSNQKMVCNLTDTSAMDQIVSLLRYRWKCYKDTYRLCALKFYQLLKIDKDMLDQLLPKLNLRPKNYV